MLIFIFLFFGAVKNAGLSFWLILFRHRQMAKLLFSFYHLHGFRYIHFISSFLFFLHIAWRRPVPYSWRINSARIMPPFITKLLRYLWSCSKFSAVKNSTDRDRHYLPHQVRKKNHLSINVFSNRPIKKKKILKRRKQQVTKQGNWKESWKIRVIPSWSR